MALPKHDPVVADEIKHQRNLRVIDTRQMRIDEIAQLILANEYELKGYTHGTGDLTERFYSAGREETAKEYHDALSAFVTRGDWESKATITELLSDEADALAAELYVIEVKSNG